MEESEQATYLKAARSHNPVESILGGQRWMPCAQASKHMAYGVMRRETYEGIRASTT